MASKTLTARALLIECQRKLVDAARGAVRQPVGRQRGLYVEVEQQHAQTGVGNRRPDSWRWLSADTAFVEMGWI